MVDLTCRTHSPSTLQCLTALLHMRNAAQTGCLKPKKRQSSEFSEADQDLGKFASLARKYRILRLEIGAFSMASD